MYLSGTGIASPILLKVHKYTPKTLYGLEWAKTSSGNYVATDRTSTNDRYESEIAIDGHDLYINQVLAAIQSNRAADDNELTLSGFNDVDDRIFGADIDYSGSIDVTVSKLGIRKQRSWRGFGVDMTLRALSPSFTGSATLPALQYIPRGYEGDATYEINKLDTYDGTYTYLDMGYDVGMWKGDVILSTANMRNMRRYIATQRGATISVPDIAGVLHPWGPRRSTNTYPISCKILEFKDNGMWGKGHWTATLTLAEVVSEV